jgi:hypothetical protein
MTNTSVDPFLPISTARDWLRTTLRNARRRPRSNSPTPTVYLDKNALSDLFGRPGFTARELLRIRRRLCSPYFKRRPRIILGQWLVAEMAPMREDIAIRARAIRRFEREQRFLEALPKPLVLRGPTDLMREEVSAAINGTVPKLFLSDQGGISFDGDWGPAWRQEFRLLRAGDRAFIAHETAAQADVAERWPARDVRARELKRWFAQPDEVVERWTLRAMRNRRRELGLSRHERLWPKPQMLRTLWAHPAIRIARIYLVNRDGRRTSEGDRADWCHSAAAVQADVFVTTDGRLRDYAAHCPPPKPQLVSFDVWARQLLGEETQRSLAA